MKITIASIKKQVLPLCKKYDLKKLALFGSQVKGNIHKDSDIDLLVEPPSNLGLIRFAGIQLEFKKLFKQNVDLVTYNSLSKYMKDEILQSAYTLYEDKN